MKWRIDLKKAHDAKQVSTYVVEKETGVSRQTVDKYVQEGGYVTTQLWANQIHKLLHYYGVKLSDVVSFVEESEGNTKTPQAA